MIKVDRSFVAGIHEAPANLAIIRAVVGLAQGLGIAVTAEGIEREEQLEALREVGCDRGQGYPLRQAGPGRRGGRGAARGPRRGLTSADPPARRPAGRAPGAERPGGRPTGRTRPTAGRDAARSSSDRAVLVVRGGAGRRGPAAAVATGWCRTGGAA